MSNASSPTSPATTHQESRDAGGTCQPRRLQRQVVSLGVLPARLQLRVPDRAARLQRSLCRVREGGRRRAGRLDRFGAHPPRLARHAEREGGLGELRYPLASDITQQVSKDYGVFFGYAQPAHHRHQRAAAGRQSSSWSNEPASALGVRHAVTRCVSTGKRAAIGSAERRRLRAVRFQRRQLQDTTQCFACACRCGLFAYMRRSASAISAASGRALSALATAIPTLIVTVQPAVAMRSCTRS
jgi:hypothetical protein